MTRVRIESIASSGARIVAGPNRGLPALVYEQTNPDLADRIDADAVAFLGSVAAAGVWDLYGGVGNTAMLVARDAEVWMVDRNRSAVAWSRRRAGGTSVMGVPLLVAPVEEAVRRLPGFRPARLTAYDLFPQTSHVETLALLEAP